MEYLEITKTSMLRTFMYKWNLLIASTMDLFRFIAEYAFWCIIFASSSSTSMYGYTLNTMLTYYIAMYIVGSITSMGNVGYRIAVDVKEGQLTNLIIKPLNCLKYFFYESLGQNIPQLLFSMIVFIPVIVLMRNKVTFSIHIIILGSFIFALFFAVILTYAINLLISLFVFWLTEIDGLFFMKEIMVDLLSGKIFPIDIMPTGVFSVLYFLPFSYCTYFPISILIDRKNLSEIGEGIIVQMLWILALFLVIKILWKKGIKRYEGTGM